MNKRNKEGTNRVKLDRSERRRGLMEMEMEMEI
jgi:hypothetical protein